MRKLRLDTHRDIRWVQPRDIYKGLIKCLNELSPTTLTEEDALSILNARKQRSVDTIVLIQYAKGWHVTGQHRVAGTASYYIEPKFIHNGGSVCHIEDVVVLSEARGMGYGKELIDFIIKIANDAGCYKVILNCDESKVGFYEKCGFHKHSVEMRLDCGGQR